MQEVEPQLGHVILHVLLQIQSLLQLFTELITLKVNLKNFIIASCYAQN